MYNYVSLSKVIYFEEFHDTIDEKPLEADVSNVLDSLTGVVSRKYIEGYAKYLISKGESFVYIISDLDNFKQINDNYGHALGDIVLKSVANSLIDYVSNKGVVGRFGGDEFIIILNGKYEYDEIHTIINGMYYNNTVYRRYRGLGAVCPFITSTIGSACYPKDATNYDDLFLDMDKALYRGKMKGRNCFIIFDEVKHGDIDISRMRKKSMYEMITNISNICKSKSKLADKCSDLLKYIEQSIRVDHAIFIDNDFKCKELGFQFRKDLFLEFDSNGIFTCNDRLDLEKDHYETFEYLQDKSILSFIIAKVCYNNKENFGYIMLYSRTTQHIWQDEELALTYYAQEVLSILLHNAKK